MYNKTQLQQALEQIFYNVEQHLDMQAVIKDQNQNSSLQDQ